MIYAGRPLKVATNGVPLPEDPSTRARRQLRQVLLTLALLDFGVLLLVYLLVEVRRLLQLANVELLLLILAGVGVVLGARMLLAVRLRRRSGDLF